jgi:ribosomal protein S18 acetylase RimI-like enzyme
MKMALQPPTLPSENGYYPLAPGKLAALTIYYERLAPFGEEMASWPIGISAFRLKRDDIAVYRTLFQTIGEKWLWVSRLEITDEELGSILDDPDTEAFAIQQNGAFIGLLELDFREKGNAEIVYVGLIEGATGSGNGRAMIEHGFARASERGVARVWLHTCHFDSTQAPRFYEKCGFNAYQLAVEIMDDPRLSGKLRADAAPHVPLVPKF